MGNGQTCLLRDYKEELWKTSAVEYKKHVQCEQPCKVLIAVVTYQHIWHFLRGSTFVANQTIRPLAWHSVPLRSAYKQQPLAIYTTIYKVITRLFKIMSQQSDGDNMQLRCAPRLEN